MLGDRDQNEVKLVEMTMMLLVNRRSRSRLPQPPGCRSHLPPVRQRVLASLASSSRSAHRSPLLVCAWHDPPDQWAVLWPPNPSLSRCRSPPAGKPPVFESMLCELPVDAGSYPRCRCCSLQSCRQSACSARLSPCPLWAMALAALEEPGQRAWEGEGEHKVWSIHARLRRASCDSSDTPSR